MWRGISHPNLGRRSRCGRQTAAPTGDSGGATHWVAAPPPLLRRGSPGATVGLLRWGLALWGGTGWWTHLGVSWATAATRAVRATGCPSSSSTTTVRVSSNGAPAHPRPPAASPWYPQAPPGLQLWRAVAEFGAQQRRLGQRRRLGLGPTYARYRALL
jgi:hypothetical protein